MDNSLKARFLSIGIEEPTIDEYAKRIAEGELSKSNVELFADFLETSDNEFARKTLLNIVNNANKIPSTRDDWKNIRDSLFKVVAENKEEILQKRNLLDETEKKFERMQDIFCQQFPVPSINSVRVRGAYYYISEEQLDALEAGSLEPMTRNPARYADVNMVRKQCEELGISNEITDVLIGYISPSRKTSHEEHIRQSFIEQTNNIYKTLRGYKETIEDLSNQVTALSLMHSFASHPKYQNAASQFLIHVANPTRDFFQKQHEYFKRMANDAVEYIHNIFDREVHDRQKVDKRFEEHERE